MKQNFSENEALYITLNDIYFKQHTLVETAREFLQNGGKLLIKDEVHKYADWSREVKNIYDLMSGLKLLITGSSILEIQKSNADLSRRELFYNMPELSFREFLAIKYQIEVPVFKLNDILSNANEISSQLLTAIEKPLFYFKEYLKEGAYPFLWKPNCTISV